MIAEATQQGTIANRCTTPDVDSTAVEDNQVINKSRAVNLIRMRDLLAAMHMNVGACRYVNSKQSSAYTRVDIYR
jgi:hypothetical protein